MIKIGGIILAILLLVAYGLLFFGKHDRLSGKDK